MGLLLWIFETDSTGYIKNRLYNVITFSCKAVVSFISTNFALAPEYVEILNMLYTNIPFLYPEFLVFILAKF